MVETRSLITAGVGFIVSGEKVILRPGQAIPEGWMLEQGQHPDVARLTSCWREIVKKKPETKKISIQKLVNKATQGPVIVWHGDAEHVVTAIQIPMPARPEDMGWTPLKERANRARTYVVTCGGSYSITLQINEKIEVVK